MFCFETSLKLFPNSNFFECVLTPFLLVSTTSLLSNLYQSPLSFDLATASESLLMHSSTEVFKVQTSRLKLFSVLSKGKHRDEIFCVYKSQ